MNICVGKSSALLLAPVIVVVIAVLTPFGVQRAGVQEELPDPHVELTRESGRSGDRIAISGTGLPADRLITVTIGGRNPVIDDVNTNDGGDFDTSFTLPALEAGTHPVRVDVDQATAGRVLTVTVPPG